MKKYGACVYPLCCWPTLLPANFFFRFAASSFAALSLLSIEIPRGRDED
jgi:hypothetical protein